MSDYRLKFRDNGAMIEVFYEQLNFEMLTESEAYGVRHFLVYCFESEKWLIKFDFSFHFLFGSQDR